MITYSLGESLVSKRKTVYVAQEKVLDFFYIYQRIMSMKTSIYRNVKIHIPFGISAATNVQFQTYASSLEYCRLTQYARMRVLSRIVAVQYQYT